MLVQFCIASHLPIVNNRNVKYLQKLIQESLLLMISVTIMQINTGIIVLYLVFPGVSLYENFQLLIPNGNRVPDPCVSYQVWNGVGHTSIFGGGVRNPFGIEFSNAGKVSPNYPSDNEVLLKQNYPSNRFCSGFKQEARKCTLQSFPVIIVFLTGED